MEPTNIQQRCCLFDLSRGKTLSDVRRWSLKRYWAF